ncbi:helix-turn-helix domain-containing protein [Pseudogulbenkiania subflava]|uniref:helix-turn-helix domain-containing protein n=1 Tax=Pseudogulbenkiania subflava TaxID=451637 RepID=UPI000A14DCC8|nr:helix-turn-helix transcriptional regulator [Pseudogulbenkiania subflava]
MNHNQIFGKALRQLRREMRLTQEELGFESEISRTHISLLELGQRSPTFDSLLKISTGLKMELSDFLILLAEKIRPQKMEQRVKLKNEYTTPDMTQEHIE